MFNFLRKNRLIAIVVGLLLSSPLVGVGQNSIDELKQEARSAKLTPDLLNLQRETPQQNVINQRGGKLRQAAPSANSSNLPTINRAILHNSRLPIDVTDKQSLPEEPQNQATENTNPRLKLMRIRDGFVAIQAVSNEADAQGLLSQLQALGLTEGVYFKRIASGYFPINKLDELKNIPALHIARPQYRPLRNIGNTTSQGDIVMKANVARQTYNVTGVGSKIGILSDSYNALKGADAGVASNDLPANVQVLKDYTEDDASDEGRGMAEIVHDVAPSANIAFHTAFDGEVDFALGIIRLAQAGCNIIVDDVGYLFSPFFQDGIIAQAVDYVKEKMNVSYFTSAGNNGNNSYTSPFRNSGKLPAGSDTYTIGQTTYKIKGSAHDFGNGTILQKASVAPGSTMILVLQWSDPFYSQGAVDFSKGIDYGILGAKTDLDILVYQKGVLMPDYSNIGYNNIGDDPVDFVYIPNDTKETINIEIAIVKADGPDPALIKLVNFNNGDPGVQADFATNSGTIFGHSNAAGAITVGASFWGETPVYSATRYPLPLIEPYSSVGGTPILFTEYGQPIPPKVRLKPEIVAPDGGNTTFFGFQLNDGDTFPNFFGTSAAAPHAAAVAALLQEKAKFSMSPDAIKKRLEVTAIDMDNELTPGFDMGFDFRTGYGFIQADRALMFGTPLVILEPLYDCATGKITLRTSGGDGTPITFTVPGVRRTPPTTTTVQYGSDVFTVYTPASTTGIVEAELRNDPNGDESVIITAEQSGVKVVYDFNFVNYCRNQNRSRVAASEPTPGLQITTLGNPIATDWVEVEVRGSEGQPLKLQVNTPLGALSSSRAVEKAESVERHKLPLGRAPGMYFLQVSTPNQSQTIKLIRQ